MGKKKYLILQIKGKEVEELKSRVKEIAGEEIITAIESIEDDYGKMYAVATLTNNIALELEDSHFVAFVNTFLSKDNLLISVDGLPPMALVRDYVFNFDEEDEVLTIKFHTNASELVKTTVSLRIVSAVKTGNIWKCTLENDDDFSNIILYDAIAI